MPIVEGQNVVIDDFINEAEASETPSENEGKVVKLEDDGKISNDFIRNNLIVDFEAAADLPANTPVGSSIAIDNAVNIGRQTIPSAVIGISGTLVSGNDQSKLIKKFGDNKFIRIIATTDSSDTLYVQVGEINRATNSVSLGTAQVVATAVNPNLHRPMAIGTLGTDKFIVFYLKDASTTEIKYRVGTISGVTITLGSEATFITAASTLATSEAWDADEIDTDKGVMFYKAATTANSRVVAFTTSGTVATAGTPQTLGAQTTLNNTALIKKIGADKFVIASDTNNRADAQVGTISGTTITMGTEAQISSETSDRNQNVLDIACPETDKFVFLFRNTTTTYYLVACSVSGTTITPGTVFVPTNQMGSNEPVSLAMRSANKIITHPRNTSNSRLIEFDLTGNTISNEKVLTNYWTTIRNRLIMFNGYFASVQHFVAGDTTLSVFYQGLSRGYLGFTLASANMGEQVPVLLRGVVSGLSGLIPGAYYGVDNGVLVEKSPTGTLTSNLENLYDVVRAISETEVVI